METTATQTIAQLAAEWMEYKAAETAAHAARKEAQALIEWAMDDMSADCVTVDGYTITRANTITNRLDTKQLRQDSPDLYARYTVQSTRHDFGIKH